MRTAAILPVKRFPLAKQRLGESVADSLRAELAQAMVGDVLSALRECSAIELTIVVTRESSVATAARYIGAIVVDDTAEKGQSAAAALGVEKALQEGFERVLCVPGDCPTLDPAELTDLLAGEARGAVIVPDRHGRGTNGLLVAPPDALSPSFGPDSRERHEQLAHEAGVDTTIREPPSLLLDIDTGEDLAVLRERLAGERVRAPRTRAVLDRAGEKLTVLEPTGTRARGQLDTVSALTARSLSGLPEVVLGADLAALIAEAISAESPAHPLQDGQIVAIAHKVVSKSEGAVVDLREIVPTARARELGEGQGKDPRAVQVVLDQSQEILRAANGVLICRTHHGFVCANAGVDASNSADLETLVVLPHDPDASARSIRARLRELTGANVGVLISDSFGRAWRHGQCDIAIGCAGIEPLEDWRGRSDSVGRELQATWLAVADMIAGTADLARAKDSREPVVLIEGLERFVRGQDGPGALLLLRPLDEDLFR